MTQCTLFIQSLDDTVALARQLAALSPRPRVLALVGHLGSGKTTFAQALGRALGVAEPLASPTFTLVNHYEMPVGTLVHGDFYRLDDVAAIAALGVSDGFSDPAVLTMIEWADRYPALFPPHTLWLTWELHEGHRTVRLETQSAELWRQLEAVWL